jgi:hypothetical protein
MDRELIILAIYINVYNLSSQHVQQVLQDMRESYADMYKDVNKDVKIYYFPVQDQDTRIECVYPPSAILQDNSAIENELLKLYKLIVNFQNEEAKDLLKDIERKLKFKKINDKLNET